MQPFSQPVYQLISQPDNRPIISPEEVEFISFRETVIGDEPSILPIDIGNIRSGCMSRDINSVVIYCDGGCMPNPGRGGYGVVIDYPSLGMREERAGGYRLTTNNRMEMIGAIVGLQALEGLGLELGLNEHRARNERVGVVSDSQYLVNGIKRGWAGGWRKRGWMRTKVGAPKNVDLWKIILELSERYQVEFKWVKGHSGHAENEYCHQLATRAMRLPILTIDQWYEESIGD